MSKKSILNILSSTNIGLNCLILIKSIYSAVQNSDLFDKLSNEFNDIFEKRLDKTKTWEDVRNDNPVLTEKRDCLRYKLMMSCIGLNGHVISTGLAITTLCINNLTKSKVAPIITFGLSTTMLLASIAIEKDSLFTLTKSSEPNR